MFNYQLKSTQLDYSTDEIVNVGCILKILHPLRQKISLLRRAKLNFALVEFIVSEYDSFHFSLKFSASFWTVFVEPGAVSPG